jgi:hypothetical protein
VSRAPEILHIRLAAILRWEKRKRIEETLAVACLYSFLAALLALPLYKNFSPGAVRWFAPAVFVFVIAPVFLLKQRWRHADSVRALARADRALRLEERALTAWDLLRRGDRGTAAVWVFKEAGERLATVDAQMLFRRSYTRRAYLILPLAALWAALLWFDPVFEFGGGSRPSAPTLTHELQRFSRELQEKAKNEKLLESLRLGEDLEKVAQKALEAHFGDERLKSEVAGVMKKFDLAGKTVAPLQSAAAGESEQRLMDLKAELEAARDMFDSARMAETPAQAGREWLERLPAMPQLQRQFDKNAALERNLSRSELQSFLERLDRQVTGELDRRALLDAQQFLEHMMKQGNDKTGEHNVPAGGRGEANLQEGARGESKGELPGTEPGKKSDGSAPLPQMQGGAATQLKGTLAPGESNGLLLKSKPSVGKSEISQDEIIASYQRQAEAELNNERVPEALKETVKQYFLSLGDAMRQ